MFGTSCAHIWNHIVYYSNNSLRDMFIAPKKEQRFFKLWTYQSLSQKSESVRLQYKITKVLSFQIRTFTKQTNLLGNIKAAFDLLHHSPPLIKEINYGG